MSNSKTEGERNASALRVAHLLQQHGRSTGDVDASSLRRLTAEVDSFLQVAPQVPPVLMEAPLSEGGDAPGRSLPCSAPEVELNVVAGVFEEKPPVGGAHWGPGGSLLLPTEATKEELLARKVEEAQALLNLMSALTPSSALGSTNATTSASTAPRIQPSGSENAGGEQGAEEDDESGVVIMDADDLEDEDTSEDDMPIQRRRVLEEMS